MKTQALTPHLSDFTRSKNFESKAFNIICDLVAYTIYHNKESQGNYTCICS